jgi:HAD superfamily hydrolase (TIGR01509 family)
MPGISRTGAIIGQWRNGHNQPAVLFDVDGTLIDSNYLHVHAWHRAFAAEDIAVETWRIHRSIGKDGSTLVAELSGGADEEVRDRLKAAHSRYFGETAALLRPLPGARELLHRVAELGLQVVLASSAPPHELATARAVLACDDVITVSTSSDDVDTAKPDPDIVKVALARAGVTAARAVFVGDAVWDARAAKAAGGDCIGLRSGGVADANLPAPEPGRSSTTQRRC